jgi:hypothetical protein
MLELFMGLKLKFKMILKILFVRNSLFLLLKLWLQIFGKFIIIFIFSWLCLSFPKKFKNNHQVVKIHHQKKKIVGWPVGWGGGGLIQLFIAKFSQNYVVFTFTKQNEGNIYS